MPQIESENYKPEPVEQPQDYASASGAQGNQVRVVGLNLAPMIAKQKQQEQTLSLAAAKPKFDLTKKFNEMNIKKDVGQKAQTKMQRKAVGSKQRNSSQPNGSKGSSRPGSRGQQMIKKNLNIEIESTDEQEGALEQIPADDHQDSQDANWKEKLNLDLAKVAAQGQLTQHQSVPHGLSVP